MSYTRLLTHIVFATKRREPELADDQQRHAMHAYLTTIAKDRGCAAIAVNGWVDHVHLLLDVPPTVAVASLVSALKANSSRWLKEKRRRAFAWQPRYAALSVSESLCETVKRYIQNQEAHHGRDQYAFAREWQVLLAKHGFDDANIGDDANDAADAT